MRVPVQWRGAVASCASVLLLTGVGASAASLGLSPPAPAVPVAQSSAMDAGSSADGGSATNLVFPGQPTPATAGSVTKPVPTRLLGRGAGATVQLRIQWAVPGRVLNAYQHAADELARTEPSCRLPWQLLAGIGRIESNHAEGGQVTAGGDTITPIVGPALNGTNGFAAIKDTDRGRWDGDRVWDRAVGPMQFIPSTWARMGRDGNHDGVADPNNVDDSTMAAAYYLCGYQGEYVAAVLAWTLAYARDAVVPMVATPAATLGAAPALAAAALALTSPGSSGPAAPPGPVVPLVDVSPGPASTAPVPSPGCGTQGAPPSLSPGPAPSVSTSPAWPTSTGTPSAGPTATPVPSSPPAVPTVTPTVTPTTTATVTPCVDPSPSASLIPSTSASPSPSPSP